MTRERSATNSWTPRSGGSKVSPNQAFLEALLRKNGWIYTAPNGHRGRIEIITPAKGNPSGVLRSLSGAGSIPLQDLLPHHLEDILRDNGAHLEPPNDLPMGKAEAAALIELLRDQNKPTGAAERLYWRAFKEAPPRESKPFAQEPTRKAAGTLPGVQRSEESNTTEGMPPAAAEGRPRVVAVDLDNVVPKFDGSDTPF